MYIYIYIWHKDKSQVLELVKPQPQPFHQWIDFHSTHTSRWQVTSDGSSHTLHNTFHTVSQPQLLIQSKSRASPGWIFPRPTQVYASGRVFSPLRPITTWAVLPWRWHRSVSDRQTPHRVLPSQPLGRWGSCCCGAAGACRATSLAWRCGASPGPSGWATPCPNPEHRTEQVHQHMHGTPQTRTTSSIPVTADMGQNTFINTSKLQHGTKLNQSAFHISPQDVCSYFTIRTQPPSHHWGGLGNLEGATKGPGSFLLLFFQEGGWGWGGGAWDGGAWGDRSVEGHGEHEVKVLQLTERIVLSCILLLLIQQRYIIFLVYTHIQC